MTEAERILRQAPTVLTNGGTETHLLFQQGFPLRDACAFEVFDDEAAWEALGRSYFEPILQAARRHGHPLMLDALVWRAHPDYIAALGYPESDLARFNRSAVERTRAMAAAAAGTAAGPAVIVAADLGPRGDGYVAGGVASPDAAYAYHRPQIEILAGTGVDVLAAITMTNVDETVGVVRAAADTGLPILVSPTVETDGAVPDGTPLGEFISRVDDATGGRPLFYMVNCAHPRHLVPTLEAARIAGDSWLDRLRGFRANASAKSHAELDESPELDRGDPAALAAEVAHMKQSYGLRVVGGCCGTDAEHIAAIAAAVR